MKKDRKTVYIIILVVCSWLILLGICFILGLVVFFSPALLLPLLDTSSKGIPQEEKTPRAIETATKYIEEKYGDVLTYSVVHEGRTGIFNAEVYRDVEFVNDEGLSFYFRVFEDYENECMYIEHETYYCYYIKDRMMEWLDLQLQESSLEEYVLEYRRGNRFSTDWKIDYSVDEILERLLQEKGMVTYTIHIPERQCGICISKKFKEELSEVAKYSNEIDINIYVYNDDDFDCCLDNLKNKYKMDSIDLEWEDDEVE